MAKGVGHQMRTRSVIGPSPRRGTTWTKSTLWIKSTSGDSYNNIRFQLTSRSHISNRLLGIATRTDSPASRTRSVQWTMSKGAVQSNVAIHRKAVSLLSVFLSSQTYESHTTLETISVHWTVSTDSSVMETSTDDSALWDQVPDLDWTISNHSPPGLPHRRGRRPIHYALRRSATRAAPSGPGPLLRVPLGPVCAAPHQLSQ